MTRWYEGPLAAFAAWATGGDVERDRIVSAALVVQDTADTRPRVTRWLVGPGVPVPPAATASHGLTDDFLHRNGRWPAPVMEEVARALAGQCEAGRPLVVMHAPFGLTILDRELRRHRASCLARYLERAPLYVLDPWVLDAHLDRYRKGPRRLTDLCARYGVTPAGERTVAAEAAAALEVVRAVGRRFAARMERLSAAEVHRLQAGWQTGGPRGLPAWYARISTRGAVDPPWPLLPGLGSAA